MVYAKVSNFLVITSYSIHYTKLYENSVNPKVVSISGDFETVEVQLLGQDLLPDDDIAVLSKDSSTNVKVALVTDTPEPIDRAIAAVPSYNFV